MEVGGVLSPLSANVCAWTLSEKLKIFRCKKELDLITFYYLK